MRIKCSQCGKAVSTEVPEGTVVRAWVECPECMKPNEELYGKVGGDNGNGA